MPQNIVNVKKRAKVKLKPQPNSKEIHQTVQRD